MLLTSLSESSAVREPRLEAAPLVPTALGLVGLISFLACALVEDVSCATRVAPAAHHQISEGKLP
jgi:hypothetical protein